jgi:hypothetical protein
LTKIEGISELETDTGTTTATFVAVKGLDVKQVLDDLSKDNKHINGWSQK